MDASLPAGALRRLDATAPSAAPLAAASTHELIAALRQRLAAVDRGAATGDLADQLGLLSMDLEVEFDTFANRFSRRHAHELFAMAGRFLRAGQLDLRGAVVVELGCGSLNPLGALLVFLLAGARQAHGFDLDPPQDERAATRALARLATYMLAEPSLLAPGLGLSRDDVARRFAGFDLIRLWLGDPGGIDAQRLQLHRTAAETTGLATASVDLTYSVSFLEHVADPAATIAELARITRPGGCGVHAIDVSDHHAYGNAKHHPLDFLREAPGPALVHGSNRLRLPQFVPLFEQHGFTVDELEVHQRIAVDEAMQASFTAPFRTLPRSDLEALGGMLFVRRR